MWVTLRVTGMTCNHCAHALSKALQAVVGVATVCASLDAGRARVEENRNLHALIRASQEAGDEAQVVESP